MATASALVAPPRISDRQAELDRLIEQQRRDDDRRHVFRLVPAIDEQSLGTMENGADVLLAEVAVDPTPEPLEQLVMAEAEVKIARRLRVTGADKTLGRFQFSTIVGVIGLGVVWTAAHARYDPAAGKPCPVCGDSRKFRGHGVCCCCHRSADDFRQHAQQAPAPLAGKVKSRLKGGRR